MSDGVEFFLLEITRTKHLKANLSDQPKLTRNALHIKTEYPQGE